MLIENLQTNVTVKFPVLRNDHGITEKTINVSVSVFDYEDETPYGIYTSK